MKFFKDHNMFASNASKTTHVEQASPTNMEKGKRESIQFSEDQVVEGL